MNNGFQRVIYTTGITTGTTVTSGASSAVAAIPNDSSGGTSSRIMLSSTGTVHVKIGVGTGISATSNDLMIGATPVVLNCRGNDHIAYIQESASAKLNVAPVEE